MICAPGQICRRASAIDPPIKPRLKKPNLFIIIIFSILSRYDLTILRFGSYQLCKHSLQLPPKLIEHTHKSHKISVIVVSGKSGVEAGTEKAWELCEKHKLPRMIYVTGMDADNASFKNVVEKLTEMYGKKIAPFHFPIRENEKFVGYVNVVRRHMRTLPLQNHSLPQTPRLSSC